MRGAVTLGLSLGLLCAACGSDREPPIVGPEPVLFANGAFDRARGELLVYIPSSDRPDLREPDGTWAFDGADWTREDAFGPLAREAPGMAFDEARAQTVMFGGERVRETRTVDETHIYGGAGWRQLDVAGPVSRHSPAMAYDPGRGGTWMYGGFGGCVAEECQVLWFFDGDTWRRFD